MVKYSKIIKYILGAFVVTFFLMYFIYLYVYNRYHLVYQEQNQLFRYSFDYFSTFISKPGGLSQYIGKFFTQFYYYRLLSALIVMLIAFVIYVITLGIFRHYGFFSPIWGLIPVMLLVALQSHHNYTIENTLDFLIVLVFFKIYISFQNEKTRYSSGIAGIIFLYYLFGGYVLLTILLCVIHEIFFHSKSYRLYIIAIYIALGFIIPYIAWKYFFFINKNYAWFYPLPFHIGTTTKHLSYLFWGVYPVSLIFFSLYTKMSNKILDIKVWNLKFELAGILLLIGMGFFVKKPIYDYKNEIFLGIDYCIQNSQWESALKLAKKYPGTNRIVTYYTNIALCKTGQLSDQMFHYNQIGSKGLYLSWKPDEITPVHGGELYYLLSYNNEAYRWAFEALQAVGPNPRSYKQLVKTSIINKNYAIAKKYLNILDQTLFYRSWARHYRELINNEKLLSKDSEIKEKRKFIVSSDFWTNDDRFDLLMLTLLKNHPDNRIVFEYYMAFLLLRKNIDMFVNNLYHLKDMGYKRIPIHYEEALLAYLSYAHKKDVIPEGYSIRPSTNQLFQSYINEFKQYRNNPLAGQALYKMFGNTYWFYFHFYNPYQKN